MRGYTRPIYMVFTRPLVDEENQQNPNLQFLGKLFPKYAKQLTLNQMWQKADCAFITIQKPCQLIIHPEIPQYNDLESCLHEKIPHYFFQTFEGFAQTSRILLLFCNHNIS